MSSEPSDSPRRTKRIARIAVVVVVGLAIGLFCLTGGNAFRMTTPDSFAKVTSSESLYGALTPQEDKLVVRHFSVREKQNLAFWVDSLRNHLVEDLGYTLKEEGELKTDAGLSGHRFLFEISIGDVPYCYQLVVFATQGWFHQHIYAAELLCAKKNFDKHVPAVETALKQFRPRRGHPG
jgi:hypothetical protein